jgi:hypothetical protein
MLKNNIKVLHWNIWSILNVAMAFFYFIDVGNVVEHVLKLYSGLLSYCSVLP